MVNVMARKPRYRHMYYYSQDVVKKELVERLEIGYKFLYVSGINVSRSTKLGQIYTAPDEYGNYQITIKDSNKELVLGWILKMSNYIMVGYKETGYRPLLDHIMERAVKVINDVIDVRPNVSESVSNLRLKYKLKKMLSKTK